MNKSNLILTISVLIVVVVFAGIYFYQKMPSQTVTATGNSQMSVSPDQATVSLLIQTKDLSAEEAKNRNSIISDNVLTALIKVGIEKKDIETENFNIYPEYDWSNGEQKLKGYAASNYIKITTKDFNNVGKIVDASVDAGALVNSINFELSNNKNNEYKAIVLAEASKDAKSKAEAIAQGLGKKLSSLVSVTASDYNYYPYPLYRAETSGVDAKEVATNLPAKNIDISASTTVTYNIK